jgi:uncharacterized protein (TIGR01777 family)
MEIAVTGSTGMIGQALGDALRAAGHRPIGVVRRPVEPGEDAIEWSPTDARIDTAALEGVHAVVHLAGAGIGDHRWTDAYKTELVESRRGPTAFLAETLAGLNRPPAVLVSASGVTYYGDRGDEELTETSGPGDLFLSKLCVTWEGATEPASEAGIRVACMRTGIVLDRHGGALPKLLPLFKLGLGGRMGSGRQWWSWITLEDEVRAVQWLIEHDVRGPANLVAPGGVTNREFSDVLGQVLHRPTFFAVPALGPRLLRGTQLANELLFASQHAIPDALTTSGFQFSHPDLETGLRAVLDRPATT